MSTIDPSVLQKEKEDRKPGTVRVGVVLVLQAVAGFAMGYGWPTVFSDETDSAAVPSIIAAAVGIPLMVISGILWGFIIVKRRELGMFYGFAAFWFGAGIGLLLTGRVLGPLLSTLFGIVALIIAAAFLTGGALAARKRESASRRNARIMARPPTTTATVSDKGYAIFSESTRMLTTVTFTFTDSSGTQRWVQRPMLVRAESPVENGQATDLWYDLADPGGDSAIVVRLAAESPVR